MKNNFYEHYKSSLEGGEKIVGCIWDDEYKISSVHEHEDHWDLSLSSDKGSSGYVRINKKQPMSTFASGAIIGLIIGIVCGVLLPG